MKELISHPEAFVDETIEGVLAHRTDKRCDLGSLAARPGWATYGLPSGPQPETRDGGNVRALLA